jgi:pilus assembly protein CpaC
MRSLLKVIFSLVLIQSYLLSSDLNILKQKDFENNTLSISTNSYKILKFEKEIKNIKLTDSTKIVVEFIDTKKPFTLLKVLAKQTGNADAFITFQDKSAIQVNFNIVPNLMSVINLTKKEYPNVTVEQIDDSIILKGTVNNDKDQKIILNIFKKVNIDSDKKVINLLTSLNPSKMVRVKLYVVEINNEKGLTVKNNWSLKGSNSDISTSITSTMLNAVTLSGGITAVANTLGNKFNVGLTLKYLESKNVAKILDETTLITLENNKSEFHSGGILNVKVSSTDITSLQKIDYGLKMDINVQDIINNRYIKLLIRTESSVLDTLNVVDGIPSIKNKTVDTNVIVDNLSTVVLGGLVNIEDTQIDEKVPLLGDIPLIGKIFRSSDKHSNGLELVFFITPEIIDPAKNNQKDILVEKTKFKNTRVLKDN